MFKDKAVARGRLPEDEVSVPDDILMENLYLKDEDDCLIRAAMLAFYKNPEKWVTGSYIKIGYFGGSDSDLQYQDEIHGPLIEQVDRAVDQVYTKYMKALIMYDGMQRVEQYMVHKDAFREILLNDAHPVQNVKDDVQDMYRMILDFCKTPKSAQEIVDEFGFSNRNYFRRHYLEEMLMTKQLKMTMPDKPSSKSNSIIPDHI